MRASKNGSGRLIQIPSLIKLSRENWWIDYYWPLTLLKPRVRLMENWAVVVARVIGWFVGILGYFGCSWKSWRWRSLLYPNHNAAEEDAAAISPKQIL
ncbi:hypothetical protein BJY04DRAFT_44666 [Aspergillus karnatakaensis]|uniref:uncharacterized protein n=1 Tax=Aspergillus karnatakaensis TaxID=1810916 RepID=UPI003CCD8989